MDYKFDMLQSILIEPFALRTKVSISTFELNLTVQWRHEFQSNQLRMLIKIPEMSRKVNSLQWIWLDFASGFGNSFDLSASNTYLILPVP